VQVELFELQPDSSAQNTAHRLLVSTADTMSANADVSCPAERTRKNLFDLGKNRDAAASALRVRNVNAVRTNYCR
jgi:hypothetical protein